MYDTVIRLRPDTFFYRPLAAKFFAPSKPLFPSGVAGCRAPCTNDHMAFLPRTAAPLYFNMADEYIYCRGTLKAPVLLNQMPHYRFAGLTSIDSAHVGYTLARNNGPDCARAGRLDATTRRQRGYSTATCNACREHFIKEYNGTLHPCGTNWVMEYK